MTNLTIKALALNLLILSCGSMVAETEHWLFSFLNRETKEQKLRKANEAFSIYQAFMNKKKLTIEEAEKKIEALENDLKEAEKSKEEVVKCMQNEETEARDTLFPFYDSACISLGYTGAFKNAHFNSFNKEICYKQ